MLKVSLYKIDHLFRRACSNQRIDGRNLHVTGIPLFFHRTASSKSDPGMKSHRAYVLLAQGLSAHATRYDKRADTFLSTI
jgi:hypothetical protein